MASKPTNHVTEALAASYGQRVVTPQVAGLPVLERGVLEALEAAYPPRCYEPGSETLERHLIYAGAVALIEQLRGVFEETPEPDHEDEEEDA